MRRGILLLPVLALAFLVAGCGGGGGGGNAATTTTAAPTSGPSLGTLLSDVATASKSQHSAHYALDATISVEGSSSNPQFQLLAAHPIKLHLDGDASSSAFTANGNVSAVGKQFSGKLLAGPTAIYLQLLGNWYGTTQLGLDKLKQLGHARMSSNPSTSQLQSLQQLKQHAEDILTGTVSDGPTLDGVSTWEFKGNLNADGIAKLSQQQGKPLTTQQQDALKTVQDSLNITLDVGKDDHLLRNFNFALDLTADQLKSLSQNSTSSLNGISAIHFSFTLGLSKWGETVTITPPSSYKPLSELSTAIAGLLQSQNGY